jgi:hypothetical protein
MAAVDKRLALSGHRAGGTAAALGNAVIMKEASILPLCAHRRWKIFCMKPTSPVGAFTNMVVAAQAGAA